MAAAKEAASHGAKVVLFDFVKPSPRGTKWGLGGTCVNVGCVPKKLMHYAGLCGGAMEDAHHFGWKVPTTEDGLDTAVPFVWDDLVGNVRNHIKSLNFSYKNGLKSAKVNYINGLAKFEDDHTLSWKGKGKKAGTVTAANFLIATGGRPVVPSDVPGADEFAITSDDLFYLDHSPEKTLCVGAGYISLESAGFLTELGFDVTVAVRSIMLRGFDRDAANKIGEVMVAKGTKFVGGLPQSITKNAEGKLVVEFKMSDGSAKSEEYDTVLYATGRYADTGGLQLEKAGVVTDGRGKFETTDCDQTNIPHVYAVGDVLAGKLELTPVAIKAGEMLARRLFKEGYTRKMDYEMISTTVFTPSEYGSVGLSEEAAIAKHGADQIESYLWQWTTLEHQAAHRIKHRSVRADQFDDMPKNCLAKLVCLKNEDEKVVGFHFIGPSAGELTQGFALAIKVGCTKADFDDCVGIHPTDAEAFCVLEVKRSEIKTEADWTASGGCGGGKCG